MPGMNFHAACGNEKRASVIVSATVEPPVGRDDDQGREKAVPMRYVKRIFGPRETLFVLSKPKTQPVAMHT